MRRSVPRGFSRRHIPMTSVRHKIPGAEPGPVRVVQATDSVERTRAVEMIVRESLTRVILERGENAAFVEASATTQRQSYVRMFVDVFSYRQRELYRSLFLLVPALPGASALAPGFLPFATANLDTSGARHTAIATKSAAAYRAASVAAETMAKCAHVPAGTRQDNAAEAGSESSTDASAHPSRGIRFAWSVLPPQRTSTRGGRSDTET